MAFVFGEAHAVRQLPYNMRVRVTPKMKGKASSPHNALTQALEAIAKLWLREIDNFLSNSWMVGLSVHSKIEVVPIAQKSVAFYEQFLPLRKNLVALLADSYRRYFRVGLAQPRLAGLDAHDWAWGQLQPAIYVASDWICDWYILACSGENRLIQSIVSVRVDPGTTASLTIPLTAPSLSPAGSWRSPAWLFSIFPPLTGIGRMKPNHIPATDSEEELSAAHSRLILKGARRAFLWDLAAVIETLRNEETAAAGAIPVERAIGKTRRTIKRTGWEQREKLYGTIRKILSGNPALQGMDLCAELDKRHARPLYDWTKSGEWREGLTWREAWRIPSLCRKIRRVRQEAQKVR